MNERTHASFFSGVGGLDMGLERAGWRTVSFSEIDPYASDAFAQRWPGVPNLGCIRTLAGDYGRHDHINYECVPLGSRDRHARPERSNRRPDAGEDAAGAALWTGGFPCQDLSVAGKRRGMGEGTRSGLAYAYLDLVGRHRPRFVLLENVPGLLSSHGGRDMAALLGALVELGYGVGYRMLDARYFGVPQRRRRVFILGDSLGGRAGAERASEVLSVGSRCRWHPPAGIEAGPGTAARPGHGIAHALRSGRFDANGETYAIANTIRVGASGPGSGGSGHALPLALSPAPDARGDGAPDGLAGRSYDRGGVVNALDQRRGGADDNEAQAGHLVVSPTLTAPDARHRVVDGKRQDGSRLDRIPAVLAGDSGPDDSDLLPLGLDSHRYRCCGNGVVSDVAEYIGARLAAVA